MPPFEWFIKPVVCISSLLHFTSFCFDVFGKIAIVDRIARMFFLWHAYLFTRFSLHRKKEYVKKRLILLDIRCFSKFLSLKTLYLRYISANGCYYSQSKARRVRIGV